MRPVFCSVAKRMDKELPDFRGFYELAVRCETDRMQLIADIKVAQWVAGLIQAKVNKTSRPHPPPGQGPRAPAAPAQLSAQRSTAVTAQPSGGL